MSYEFEVISLLKTQDSELKTVINMGIDRLTTSLLAEAKRQAEDIVKTAEGHLDKMLMEEKAKRAILLKKAEEDAMQLIDEQRKERIASSRLEAKRILNEAKEDAIKAVLEDLYAMLDGISKKPNYKDFLKRTIASALAEMNSTDLILHCKKEDKAVIQTLVGNAKIYEDVNAFGGFILESSDGKVRLNLTLESLFESKRDDLRKMVYQKLFETEEKKQEVSTKAGSQKQEAIVPKAKPLEIKRKKVRIDEAT